MGVSSRVGRQLPGVALTASLALAALAAEVPSSPEEAQPLPVGASVPSVRVRPVEGAPVDLAELVAERGALLVFYRGGW